MKKLSSCTTDKATGLPSLALACKEPGNGHFHFYNKKKLGIWKINFSWLRQRTEVAEQTATPKSGER